MEFRVGSNEEIIYLKKIIQKQVYENESFNKCKIENIKDFNEYKYLQFLVFKYCYIPNAML